MIDIDPIPRDTGDIINPPAQERIISLMELDDAAYEAGKAGFLDARLAELTEASTARVYSALVGSEKGFVSPESEILPQASGIGYRLDDTEPYRIGLDELRKYYPKYRQKMPAEKALLNAGLKAAQYAEVKYFGNVQCGTQAAAQRENLLADNIDDDTPYRSIAEFKGKAMCAERAFVCNNILQVFGIEPVVELGSVQIGDEPKVLHAYLLVEATDGSIRIFDPQNPTWSFDSDNKPTRIAFTTYIADALVGRGTDRVDALDVVHKTFRTDVNGQKTATESPRVYKLGGLP